MSNKKIYLGKGLFSVIDECNYDRLKKYTWCVNRSNYATTNINGKNILMHRFIMELSDNTLVIDHIDGDRLDNRLCNLRVCTQGQNMCNKLPRRNGTSKYNGVIYHQPSNKWLAKITTTINNKRLWCNIGFYTMEEEAGLAFNIVAKELRGDYVKLNEINLVKDIKIKKRSLAILRNRLNIELKDFDNKNMV